MEILQLDRGRGKTIFISEAAIRYAHNGERVLIVTPNQRRADLLIQALRQKDYLVMDYIDVKSVNNVREVRNGKYAHVFVDDLEDVLNVVLRHNVDLATLRTEK